MKILHVADLHLGSKIESKFPKNISDEIKSSVRNSFRRLVEYAINNKIKIILLAGDIFDSNKPTRKDKEFFYSVIKSNPDIDFLYLKGNHDLDSLYDESYPNLKLFNDKWTSYNYDNVVISGIELSNNNKISYYSTLLLERNYINIVMLHGQINDDINLIKLKDKNIDYLALGHIHSYESNKIDERAIYAYSGCLEPRGFDELGSKGFIELEIINNKIIHKFIPFSKRIIIEKNIDIQGFSDAYEISKHIKQVLKIDKNNIYRINLIGNIDIDIEDLQDDVKEYLEDSFYFIDVKDKTKRNIDIHQYDYDLSIKGKFIRKVYNDNKYTEEQKLKIITLGLKYLQGKE